ncbi:phosphoglycerate mutase-like protein [Hypoxylon sp. EC38]|nr:phosphoglycerate mutase-like protein [Hypoxylon sp. EC38]
MALLIPQIVVSKIHKFSYISSFFENCVEIANSSPSGKVSTLPSLGIIKRDYDGPKRDSVPNEQSAEQWSRFASYVEYLNHQHLNDGISYKLIYVIRHGRGVHNVRMDELKILEKEGQFKLIDGIPLNWKNYWARKEGNGNVIWADAQLVEDGIIQAQNLAKLWLEEDEDDALPLPKTIYTSPLARCLETTKHVYSPAMAKYGRNFQPIIKEDLRERLTTHTCDRRSSRSWIELNYPGYVIEEGFPELDTRWDADTPETLEQHIIRTQRLLDDIFTNDTSPIISLTTHSYTITSILAVVGYPKFLVNEGTIVPLFVKAEKVAQPS